MARRQNNDDDGGAMDSLLDTMTNVVGILVIVLVVTQLGVGDAVNRISKTIDVDPKALKAKQERLTEIDKQQTLLNTQMQLLNPDVAQDDSLLDAEIEALKKRLKDESLKLDNLKKSNISAEQALVLGEKEMEAEKKRREKLETDIKDALAESAKLKATLEQTPDREVLPAIEMRLPDPRPAPEGVQPFTLICSSNRIYPLQFSAIQVEARKRATNLLATKKFLTDPVKGVDADRFVKEFARKPFKTDFFDISLVAHPDGMPRLVCAPLERKGATLSEVDRKNSTFNKDLAKVGADKYYLRFFVCGDSFDIYMSARAAAERQQLSVGWIPQPAAWKFTGQMGGDIRLGPPKPKPPPKKTDPNNPPPKPKPRNDID